MVWIAAPRTTFDAARGALTAGLRAASAATSTAASAQEGAQEDDVVAVYLDPEDAEAAELMLSVGAKPSLLGLLSRDFSRNLHAMTYHPSPNPTLALALALALAPAPAPVPAPAPAPAPAPPTQTLTRPSAAWQRAAPGGSSNLVPAAAAQAHVEPAARCAATAGDQACGAGQGRP